MQLRKLAPFAVVAVALLFASHASAQKWPEKPVRIVTPFATGGGTDFFSRLLATQLTETYRQQFIVENRPGAGSTIGTEYVARAAPDGYTFLMTSASFALNPGLYPKLRYDSINDLAAVSMVAAVPHIIAVNPSLPVKNLQELIALAKNRPGQVMYSTAGRGSAMHLAGALFGRLSGADLTQVPYKGSPEAVTAVMSGEATMMFPTIETVMPHIRSGRIRAIAVSTAKRTPALPDVPTAIEAGVKGYDVATWFGVFAPAKTPPTIVENLSAEIAKALTVPSVRDKITVQGAQPVGNTPAEFQKIVKEEIEKWTRIIREAKITLD